jgi:hypothetical protein
MVDTLKKFNSNVLAKQKTMIQRVFLVALLFNLLATLFYTMAIPKYRFINNLYTREYIEILTWPIFDLPVITSIMWLHYRSFGQQLREGHSIVNLKDIDNQKQVWTNYTTMQA